MAVQIQIRSQLIWIYTVKAGYIRVQQDKSKDCLWQKKVSGSQINTIFGPSLKTFCILQISNEAKCKH